MILKSLTKVPRKPLLEYKETHSLFDDDAGNGATRTTSVWRQSAVYFFTKWRNQEENLWIKYKCPKSTHFWIKEKKKHPCKYHHDESDVSVVERGHEI